MLRFTKVILLYIQDDVFHYNNHFVVFILLDFYISRTITEGLKLR